MVLPFLFADENRWLSACKKAKVCLFKMRKVSLEQRTSVFSHHFQYRVYSFCTVKVVAHWAGELQQDKDLYLMAIFSPW